MDKVNKSLAALSSGKANSSSVKSDEFNKYLATLPPGSEAIAQTAWNFVPADLRKELNLNIKLFSNIAQANPAALGDIMELLKRQAGPAFAPISKIAVLGPVNVGKSTLFNALLNGIGETADVSPIPGTTVKAQNVAAGAISLIDTPGFNNATEGGQLESALAMQEAEKADFLIILFDVSRGITVADRNLYNTFKSLHKPYLIALNKMDLIDKKLRDKAKFTAAASLGLLPEQLYAISAQNKEGVYDLLLAAAYTEPRLLGEMGKLIPTMRQKLGWQAIRRATVISGAIALTPLPFASFIPLTANQITMVLSLARVYDRPITYKMASELLTTLGIGFLGRTLAGQLSQMAGPPGWLVSASIAATCTIAIGYACMLWFESDIKPSGESFKRLFKAVGDVVWASLKNIKSKKADKPKLDEAVQQAIDKVTSQLKDEEFQKMIDEAQAKEATNQTL